MLAETNQISMSFGCVGARTYTGLTPSELVLTVAGSELADLVERLQTTVAANAALASFHQGQKESSLSIDIVKAG